MISLGIRWRLPLISALRLVARRILRLNSSHRYIARITYNYLLLLPRRAVCRRTCRVVAKFIYLAQFGQIGRGRPSLPLLLRRLDRAVPEGALEAYVCL